MTSAQLKPGDLIGPYRVLEPLGWGGMGVVYRARHTQLLRDVALKVLPPETADDGDARARLVREAQSMAALRHEHICTVFDVLIEPRVIAIAMELVEGEGLDRRIRESGLSLQEVIRLGREISDAVGHAHERGLAHRDLKPGNVLIRRDGRAVVMDLGLAKPLQPAPTSSQDETEVGRTRPGHWVGTPHYLAPEVLRGALADERSDVWAIGVMLYEMLTRDLPFQGSTSFEVAGQILQGTPAPFPSTVPAALKAVVACCLEKEPARRYRQAGEVCAALRTLELDPAAGAEPAFPSDAGNGGGRGRTAKPAPTASVWRSPVVAVVGGLLLVAATAWFVRWQRVWSPTPPVDSIRALAVLPLENLSHDQQQAYFADGMTEEISARLAQISALKVIARGSVSDLVKKQASLEDIGRRLGVQALLRGTVFNAEGRVAITVQLVDAATGDLRWAQSYQRPLVDILALQSEVALAIAHEIQVELTPQESNRLSASPKVDPEAYEAYLRGRAAWGAYTLEAFQESERHFRRALELAPGYAPAWAGLADAAYGMSSAFVAPNVAIPRARNAASRALMLDSTLAEAQTSMGIVNLVYDWDWPAAQHRFETATRLRPGDANARFWSGHALALRGRSDEGIQRMRQAIEIDPLSSFYTSYVGWHLYFARRYDLARKHLQDALLVEPDYYPYHVFLGMVLEQQGEHPAAIASLERGVEMYSGNDNLAQLAHAYATGGRRSDALRIADQLIEKRKATFVPAGNIAYIYAGLADRERSFRWLQLALEDHSEILTVSGVDPGWDPIRSDARFEAMLRRVRLRS